jgi:4-carboxymuconolactone decarboxylase
MGAGNKLIQSNVCRADVWPNQPNMVRIAKIVVDQAQVESYKAALKEEIEASVRLEPGVLTLYAVS